ncbi:hypothetical protein ACFL0L_05320 [Patescibacteria group bacterium]
MALPDEKPKLEQVPQSIEDIFDGRGEGEPVKTPEREKVKEAVEQKPPEQAPKAPEQEVDIVTKKAPQAPPPVPPVLPTEKSERLKEIESILSDGIEDIFLELPPEQQIAFQKKGEEVATEVYSLLQQTKVQVNRILFLIKEWLKIIPAVNKFFLEREAKIKTDRLLALRGKQE